MSSITERLTSLSTLGEFDTLVNEIDTSNNSIHVSFIKGVKLSLVGHSRELTLTSLVARLNQLLKTTLNADEIALGHRILLKIKSIDDKAEAKIKLCNSATRAFLQYKRNRAQHRFNRKTVSSGLTKKIK